jgi:ubiquinone/menaquinone biosynthesis C-methylase UbiE
VAAQCRRITGCDFSAGMLEQFRRNAAEAGLKAFEALQCDLSRDLLPPGRYGALTSSMTLHHVADVPGLLRQFAALLLPGGLIVLTDLEIEDGSFHGPVEGVAHMGFDPVWMAAQLEAAGFAQVRVRRAVHQVEKPGAGGVMRSFPVFLVSAIRQ